MADQQPSTQGYHQDLVNLLLARAVDITYAVDTVTTAHAIALAHRDYASAAHYSQAKQDLQQSRDQLVSCANNLLHPADT